MCKKNNPWLLLLLACSLVGLLSTFVALSDYDHDGLLDSIASEEFLLAPAMLSIMVCFWLFVKVSAVSTGFPQHFFRQFVPPPIFSN